MTRQRIAFIFVGGAHQVLHSAPVAAELGLDPRFEITCFVAEDAERAIIERLLTAYPDSRLAIEPMPAPWWGRIIAAIRPKAAALKLPRLLRCRRRLMHFDAIVTAERTTTILKHLSRRTPPLIHIPHGAGDRAKGFEPRLRLFDLVIVSGQKDAARMIEAGVVDRTRCVVSGSIKLAAVERLAKSRPILFDNERPVVLYNPHFDTALGSWNRWGNRLIDAFGAQNDYNLIVAPHVRLYAAATGRARAAIARRAVPGRIVIDTGSPRSCDMTYTLAADVYVGDVSSQVYEFLSLPRPCVFLNAAHADWRDDPNYAFWHFGEVVDDPAEILPAIGRAQGLHPRYIDRQRAAVAAAVGSDWSGSAARAAAAISTFLADRDLVRPGDDSEPLAPAPQSS